jgi:uncharacterized protein Yka (UPF0111/DUF47 family)
VTIKSGVVEALGESEVLLPGLLSAALAANDRIKARLSFLQEAVSRANAPVAQGPAPDLQGSGLEAEMPATALLQAKLLGPDLLFLPGAAALLAGLKRDLDTMLAPLTAAGTPEAPVFAARVQSMQPRLEAAAPDDIAPSLITALTSANRDGGDKFHLLVMDLHKALNQLASTTATENLDGAMVLGLTDEDRQAVRAFMRGLHRTAPLAFGHPGLGTTAVHAAGHLTIQNDIGTTDAHVLVVHVTDVEVTVTYTDIHRARAKFFISMFAAWDVAWSPLNQRQAQGLKEDAFYLVNGRFAAQEPHKRETFLEYLGSRLVFLIDWNKARKALQIFQGKNGAIELLTWAASHDYGHRGFLELGGAELLYEAVQRGATGRIRYGERLDAALGETECADFLRGALRTASEGLSAGRSVRLIRDEIQADLAHRFETAENTVFALLVRHLGLSHCMAEGIVAGLERPGLATDFTRRAKTMEEKAGQLTTKARELATRLQGAATLRRVIDQVENTADALEDSAWLMGLISGSRETPLALLLPLAGIVADAVAAMVRAVEATCRLPEGRQADTVDALQAVDAVVNAERAADTAQRDAFAALLALPGDELRPLLLCVELARALEGATDQLSHAAFALRERVLGELSA